MKTLTSLKLIHKMQPQKISVMILLISGTLLIVLLGINHQANAQQWNTDSLAAELK
jgi:hypothetical protein